MTGGGIVTNEVFVRSQVRCEVVCERGKNRSASWGRKDG
jgi:hypothetical protein